LNKVLLAQNQELETQLAVGSREIAGKYFVNIELVMPKIILD
jgi:hypothetical protein